MPDQQQNGQLTDLLIKANELAYLNNIIEQIPTKFGLPLVNFFSQVAAMRKQEEIIAQQREQSELKEKDTPSDPYVEEKEKTKPPRTKKSTRITELNKSRIIESGFLFILSVQLYHLSK